MLDSHGTFMLAELLESIKESSTNNSDSQLSKSRVSNIFYEARSNGNYSSDEFFNDLKKAITTKDTTSDTIIEKFVNGTSCKLLQPDGKGWQKGKLKICFEFICEEPVSVEVQSTLVDNNASPLDEIRQLSNELASATATEQN